MTPQQLKKVMRLLKRAYDELEAEALKAGVAITSPEYEQLVDKVRTAVLQKEGFTVEEFRSAKEELETERVAKKETEKQASETVAKEQREAETAKTDRVFEKISMVKGEKGDKGDRGERGEVGLVGPRGPEGKAGKDGKDGRPGRDGKDGRDGRDTPETMVAYLEDLIQSVDKKIPTPETPDSFRAKVEAIIQVSEVAWDSVKKNLDIMGMPDFRKLAMGLQAQIDELNAATATSIEFETPTGTVNDTNVTFTATQTPIYIIQNGLQYFEDAGYTLSGLTITLTTPVGTGGFIRSAYNAS